MKKLIVLMFISLSVISCSCSSKLPKNSYYNMQVEVISLCGDIDTVQINTFYPDLHLSDYNELKDSDWNIVATNIVSFRVLTRKIESVK